MVLGLSPWQLVTIASGVALAGVGIYAARVGRGEHANRAFGLYAVGFGLAAVFDNALDTSLTLSPTVAFGGAAVVTVFCAAALVGLGRFAVAFPRPLAGRARRLYVAPLLALLIGLVGLVPRSRALWHALSVDARHPLVTDAALLAGELGLDVLRVGLMSAALLFALRMRALRDDASDEAQRIAIVTAAFVIYPMGFSGWKDAGALARGDLVGGSPLLFHVAVLAGITLLCLAATRSRYHHAAARNVAIIGWAAGLLGMALGAGGAGSPSWIMRAVEILLIAYAVVKYQMLGIDVRLRWGISKGTVGAVFVAVFFVTSEAAQQFFGARVGNSYVGIAAAAALVFALAPLQRAADRLAEHALPSAPLVAAPAPASAAALYRRQVETAWTDGRISPNERVMLRGLRKELGIDPATADAIDHEVELARMRAD